MPNTYTLLETITVGAAGAASVTFNSIPQTGYTDLVIKYSGRSSIADVLGLITLNGSAVSYSGKRLYGTGSAAVSNAGSTTSFNPPSIVASTFTANTFGNGEIYIPNFTSANYKSVSIDAVTENNATESYTTLYAGLWSNTAAVTSVSLAANGGSWAQYSTFSLSGVSALGVTPTKAPKATGGDIIMTDGTYWIHTFLSSGTFKPATGLTCDYLVVAGGGSGGQSSNERGGGGGAGGLRSTVTATGGGGSLESALTLLSGTSYTVTVGAGGASNSNGSDSVFSTITATGGGRGGFQVGGNPNVGGSGGGGRDNGSQSGAAGTANQGFAGGQGRTDGATYGNSGGGGGAGGVGQQGNTSAGSTPSYQSGGVGVATSISGSSVTYAGGGGGGGDKVGLAGTGGGNGGNGSTAPTAATANLGGGGGGSSYTSGQPATAGGSGVVIVRYLA